MTDQETPRSPNLGKAVVATAALLLAGHVNEVDATRVQVDRSPTLRESHGLLASTPHQYDLEYLMPRAPVDYTVDLPTLHMKMTPGRITVRQERAVPEQLALFP